MVRLQNVLILSLFVGSGHHQLVQATQDATHYFLPDNIYDNLPPGIEVPEGARENRGVPSTPVETVARSDKSPLPYGPNDPPSIDISAPLLNSIHTPGSSMVMAWTDAAMTFPADWVPPKGLMDTITQDPNFSHSLLLTDDDMVNLAKIKLEEMRRLQTSNILKDSPMWLHHLRLVSPTSSDTAPPYVLSDQGFNLVNASRLNLSNSTGGELMWRIPEDWNHEGEFEIVIPFISGIHLNDGTSYPGAKSLSFWILRDAATREQYPSYSSDASSSSDSIQKQKQLGVFLGVAAMMSAFILVGLGVMVSMYRKKWVAQQQQQQQMEQQASMIRRSSTLSSSSSSGNISPPRSAGDFGVNPFLTRSEIWAQQGVNPLDLTQGDEDAHSPTDLSLGDPVTHVNEKQG
ncbi:hypothetical protein CPC16_003898 [Podila verticillata]|nr:hypothetical protein CPC16_003898 [Podila verticillata]KAI9240293.1 MAG: hypothetical protein BYD32DRAFT_458955 [Podila humilis]